MTQKLTIKAGQEFNESGHGFNAGDTVTLVKDHGDGFIDGTAKGGTKFYGRSWDRFEVVKTVRNPGDFATGKGTTESILNYLQGRSLGRNALEIGTALNLPARQLSKRLAEQVKRKVLTAVEEGGRKVYIFTDARATGEKHPDYADCL